MHVACTEGKNIYIFLIALSFKELWKNVIGNNKMKLESEIPIKFKIYCTNIKLE